jgi:hypothetical protein
MADCPHGDSHCPCQDGDACHYEDVGDSKAWPFRDVIPLVEDDGDPQWIDLGEVPDE